MVRASIAFVGLVALALAAGCKNEDRLIEKVTFKPSENLETVRVSLVFGKRVQTDLAGGFALKDYGYLFLNAYTSSQPFEVGFDLNTSIVNDQDYVKLTPTTVLPNGVPLGLPYALVEVGAAAPIHEQFDLHGYVDVLHANWLGVAAMFKFLSSDYFPAGLSLSQVFLRDSQGRPGVLASVFGPVLDGQGHLVRNGGVALLANVRQLIDEHTGKPKTLELRAEPEVLAAGPAAVLYDRRYVEFGKIEDSLIEAMNTAAR